MLFGIMQQLFFLWVFTDTVHYLTKNLSVTYLISVAYFMSVHFSLCSRSVKLWVLLIIFSVVNTFIYLFWQNILPQMLFHGIGATVLLTAFFNVDHLRKRFG
jgi:uncharacterized membrane protein